VAVAGTSVEVGSRVGVGGGCVGLGTDVCVGGGKEGVAVGSDWMSPQPERSNANRRVRVIQVCFIIHLHRILGASRKPGKYTRQ